MLTVGDHPDDDDGGMYFSEPELSVTGFDTETDKIKSISFRYMRELRATRSASIGGSESPSSRDSSSIDPPVNSSRLILKHIEDGRMFNSPTRRLSARALSEAHSSAQPSEDEDGTLLKTLTSEGAEQVAAAVAAAKFSTPPVSPSRDHPIGDHAWSALLELVSGEMGIFFPHEGISSLPPSLLRDYALLPVAIENLLNHGILVCLSGLLYEVTFMPLSGILSLIRWCLSFGRVRLNTIDLTNMLRTFVLMGAFWVFNNNIDFSAVYHYIRAQSLLKLYLLFNMLEIIERLVRSWGNDIVDGGVKAVVDCQDGKRGVISVLLHWVLILIYTLGHTYIHFWRVMLVSVAIVSSDSSMFMIVLTNNFAELKGTVFKKYESRSLYPVITSDIVERMYLFVDAGLVLFRMVTSPQKRKMPFSEVVYWVGVMMIIEILTDWIKLLCVTKFNQLDTATFTQYKQIHVADILNARNDDPAPIPPLIYKGVIAPSHLPIRRMNFMCTPLVVLIMCNVMLPNLVGSEPVSLWGYRLLVVVACFLGKLIVDWILIGTAANAPHVELPEKLQNIRAL